MVLYGIRGDNKFKSINFSKYYDWKKNGNCQSYVLCSNENAF